MKSLKGSKTEKNLLAAFAGESQARNRYTYAASKAKKEGYEQIAAIFSDTADNEKEHAKVFFAFLEGGDVEITAAYPAGKVGTTLENLKASAAGEHFEWTTLYAKFAAIAAEEGYPEVAESFRHISISEKGHEARYAALAKNIIENKVFAKGKPAKWRCRNCGYITEAAGAPDKCPACQHPKDYYEIGAENY
ncbi:MAG: rubrerythrin family protein [Elusimicrobia bacterium]|nr:rubrerythrin family protein [Elusimicrobiota bacterium]